jgi:hypothetical protein
MALQQLHDRVGEPTQIGRTEFPRTDILPLDMESGEGNRIANEPHFGHHVEAASGRGYLRRDDGIVGVVIVHRDRDVGGRPHPRHHMRRLRSESKGHLCALVGVDPKKKFQNGHGGRSTAGFALIYPPCCARRLRPFIPTGGGSSRSSRW